MRLVSMATGPSLASPSATWRRWGGSPRSHGACAGWGSHPQESPHSRRGRGGCRQGSQRRLAVGRAE